MEIFTRAEMLEQGSSPVQLQGQIRRGELVRLCRGVYGRADEQPDDAVEHHRARVLAHTRRSDYAVSHASAAVVHGLPIGGADLREVHVTRLGLGGQRHVAGRRVHSGQLDREWCTVVDGVVVTTVARTIADLLKCELVEVAVAAADAALHQRQCTREEIMDTLAAMKFHPGGPRARRSMALVDGRAESPGETRTRLVLDSGPLPRTDLQISIFDESDRFVARVDGGYPERGVFWEYDGRAKYEALLRPGQSSLDAILAEKTRESRVTELGSIVVRIDKHDLRAKAQLHDRLLRALARSDQPGWVPPRGRYVVPPRV